MLMKQLAVLWIVALCGASVCAAQGRPSFPDAKIYELTCSADELKAETERCAKLPAESAAAKPTKAKKKKGKKKEAQDEPVEPAAVPVEWTPDMMARRYLMSRMVKDYLSSGDAALLEPYAYKQRLFVSSFYTPLLPAAGVQKMHRLPAEQPTPGEQVGLLMVVRTQVKAPKAGTYRFVGAGSDFIIVRLNGKSVLEAGDWLPTLMKKNDPRKTNAMPGSKHFHSLWLGQAKEPYAGYALATHFKEIPTWNARQGGLTIGSSFSAEADVYYPLEVIIGCAAGSEQFGYVLYVEDLEKPVEPGKPYPLLRFNNMLPNARTVKEMQDYWRQTGILPASATAPLEAPPVADGGMWSCTAAQ